MLRFTVSLICLFAAFAASAQATVKQPPTPRDIAKWDMIRKMACTMDTNVRYVSIISMQSRKTLNPKIDILERAITIRTADGEKFMEVHTDYRSKPAKSTTYLLIDGTWKVFTDQRSPELGEALRSAERAAFKTPGERPENTLCKTPWESS